MISSQQREGAIYALTAYGLWGFMPIYFKQMGFISGEGLLAHRIIWSCLVTLIFILFWRRIPLIIRAIKNKNIMLTLCISSLIVGGNWLIFIWAVQHNHMLDASLGYYINPIINIALGMIFLGERLRRMQWIAVMLAFTGVMIQVVAFKQIPIVAISLALSFSIYGLIRKKAQVDAQVGLFIETLILLGPAVIYLEVFSSDAIAFTEYSSGQMLLLLLAGPVTSIPLMLFTAASQRLNYSTMGFLQYIAPSIMFLCAVFLYKEPLKASQLITFGFIWVALFMLSFEAILKSRQSAKAA